jgi:DNA polymerase-2
MLRELDGFVLTRQWRDDDDGVTLTFWLATDEGPLRVVQRGCEAVTFVERGADARADRQKQVELSTMFGKPVDALYFRSQRRLVEERDRLRRTMHACLEGDLKPQDRYLMERFITSSCRVKGKLERRRGYLELQNASMKAVDYQPNLSLVSFDIETDGIDGPIISISLYGRELEQVLMVGRGRAQAPWLAYVRDERALLSAFFEQVGTLDPDVLIGWNVVEFDLSYIQRRCDELGLRFTLGRGSERARVLEAMRPGQLPIARVPGRVVLDGITTLRTATYSFESFSLEHVSQQLLGRGKLIAGHERADEIQRLYRDDPEALAAYNLQDSRLVWEIFEHTSLLSFALQRQRMTGLPMDRAGGSVAAFDYLYLPRLHREGYVAFDAGSAAQTQTSPGGYVLPSQPGLYRNVLVLDFKSLYPSIIRTFRIDPLGLAFPGADPIEGFEGASFSRHRAILPDLITELWQDRDRAKAEKNQPLSRAIKILMNSFYGVLGTPGCRFFSPRLASSITRRGHQIITASRDWLEARKRTVIYGDTDSLFVHLGHSLSAEECNAVGGELARELNAYWRARVDEEHGVPSYLEIEFETHYTRFFMPTLRGSDEGSAKRYAGLVLGDDAREPQVIVKGLEAVRTDWTPLARRFQRELLRRVFFDEAVEEFARETRRRMLAGELDDELTYTKRLRRDLGDYVANVPPHVKAARMLERPGRSVSYLMTIRGPEPVELQSAPIDYHHYLERQLAPAADGLLQALGTSFEAIAGDQLALF